MSVCVCLGVLSWMLLGVKHHYDGFLHSLKLNRVTCECFRLVFNGVDLTDVPVVNGFIYPRKLVPKLEI